MVGNDLGCHCREGEHVPQRLVVTGGPGAGKTAVLEMAKTSFCAHVEVLPEAASILFKGGFPRLREHASLKAAQRAIFHVQNELEAWALERKQSALVLCDRGTIDGLAYWPDGSGAYFDQVGTTLENELSRYLAVIHLRTPPKGQGYNHQNPQRIETAEEAQRIDERIFDVWRLHPRRFEVVTQGDFLNKARRALEVIENFVPPCCRAPAVDAVSNAMEKAR